MNTALHYHLAGWNPLILGAVFFGGRLDCGGIMKNEDLLFWVVVALGAYLLNHHTAIATPGARAK
jgi:hypothetical protein